MQITAREKALVRLANKASTELSGKEGYIAEYDSGLKLSGGTNALGVITEGGAASSDVAIIGTFDGILRVMASGTIAVGDKLKVDDGGTVSAYVDSGTVIGVALQAGAAGELVEAALCAPTVVVVDPSDVVDTKITAHAALTTGVHGLTGEAV